MDKETSLKEHALNPSASVPVARAGFAPKLAIGLALILALCGLGASGFVWQELRSSQQLFANQADEASKLQTRQNQVHTQLQADLKAAQTQQQADTAKLSALEAKLLEATNQQAQLDKVTKDLVKNRDEWDLAEVEQSIRLASQQLQLTGNTTAAVTALRDADARLARMNQAVHASVRRLLARDIDKLNLQGAGELTAFSNQIDQLMLKVDQLRAKGSPQPVIATDKPASKTEAAVQSKWGGWLQDIRQLVQIRRLDASDAQFASPEQQYFLRENLKLRLASLRLAVMSRNEVLTKTDVDRALEMLKRGFEVQDRDVLAVQESLTRLRSVPSNELPSLADTLSAVQALRQSRTTAGGRS